MNRTCWISPLLSGSVHRNMRDYFQGSLSYCGECKCESEPKMKESNLAAILIDLLSPCLSLFVSCCLASANVTVNSLCMLMLPAVLHHTDCSPSLIIHHKRFPFRESNLHQLAHVVKQNDKVCL